jgi:hypothetical protein
VSWEKQSTARPRDGPDKAIHDPCFGGPQLCPKYREMQFHFRNIAHGSCRCTPWDGCMLAPISACGGLRAPFHVVTDVRRAWRRGARSRRHCCAIRGPWAHAQWTCCRRPYPNPLQFHHLCRCSLCAHVSYCASRLTCIASCARSM